MYIRNGKCVVAKTYIRYDDIALKFVLAVLVFGWW